MEFAVREKILVGAALLVGGFVLFGPSGSDTVEPARGRAALSAAGERDSAAAAPRAGHGMWRLANRVADAASDAALFAAHSWYTPPPPPPPAPPPVAVAPPAPTAPPLPFAYMGSYLRDGDKPVYFLTRNDRIYDVKAGDTLDNVYTFDGLSGNVLMFTYKPLNTRQTLAVDGAL